MAPWIWITLGGVLMSAIAVMPAFTVLRRLEQFPRRQLVLVAFAAGALLGGALFHMLPHAVAAAPSSSWAWVAVGFSLFLALELLMQWHHCRRPVEVRCRGPQGWMLLLGDGLHNLLGGLAVGGAFLADPRLGLTAWAAAAAHEVPQEIGELAALMHSGWPRARAVVANLLSSLAFLVGGLLALVLSRSVSVAFLVPLAAGNFLYLAAADLVPEFKTPRTFRDGAATFLGFLSGLGGLLGVARWLPE